MQFLKKDSEYRRVYSEHKRIRGRFFTLLVQRREEKLPPVFGIVVRKKVGNAVIRNKIKRRLRAYLRENEENLPRGMAAIIIANNNAATASWQNVVDDLSRCINKMGR